MSTYWTSSIPDDGALDGEDEEGILVSASFSSSREGSSTVWLTIDKAAYCTRRSGSSAGAVSSFDSWPVLCTSSFGGVELVEGMLRTVDRVSASGVIGSEEKGPSWASTSSTA